MPKAKRPGPADLPDPDRLVRQAAGTYRTSDERFEVRNGGTGWFLVDTTQANDFGQELILGPYATLAAVREAIPPARSTKVTPIRRSPTARRGRTTRKPQSAPPPEPVSPPPPDAATSPPPDAATPAPETTGSAPDDAAGGEPDLLPGESPARTRRRPRPAAGS